MTKPPLVSEAEAAAYFGIDITTFRRLVTTGFLPGQLDSGLFDLHAIDAAHSELSALAAKWGRSAELSDLAQAEAIFLVIDELATRWRISEQRLRNMYTDGEGPTVTKLPSGSIRYRLSDVLAAEAMPGGRGFRWSLLRRAMKSFPRLSASLRKALLHHLRMAMKE